jgi:hypothetical protein
MPQEEHRSLKKKKKKKNPNVVERRLHGYRGQWVAIPTTFARHWSELGLKPEDALLLIGPALLQDGRATSVPGHRHDG